MATFLRVFIMAIIAALIGWLTNLLAIKMIFRPLNPITIPILGWQMQGIIPKRRYDIAVNIGKTVEEELISMDDVFDMLIQGENRDKLLSNIKVNINRIVDEKLPSIVPSFIRNNIHSYISKSIDDEAGKIIDGIIHDTIDETMSTVSIAKMVEDKINSFDLLTLENMIISISQRELKHIEILGGLLGFVIGLVQGILMLFMP